MHSIGLDSLQYTNAKYPIIIRTDCHTLSDGSRSPHSWHEDLEIKLVRSPYCTVLIDSRILRLESDDIFFVNPYQMHSTATPIGENEFYDLIILPLDYFQVIGNQSMYLRQLFIQQNIRVRNNIKNPILTKLLHTLFDVSRKKSTYKNQIIEGILLQFFSVLLECEIDLNAKFEQNEDRIRYYASIGPALDAIHNRYHEKLTIDELAKLCTMSVCHFCHVFKRVMGITVMQYLTEHRMHVADVLLENTQHSITQIAQMVGIFDEAYFSRCYKRYKGISPRIYRQNNKKYGDLVNISKKDL